MGCSDFISQVAGFAFLHPPENNTKGYKNFGSLRLTGEVFFLNKIKNYNIDYSLDIGANIGNHSVFFADDFLQVYSFEPLTQNFDLLKINSKLKKKYNSI